MIHPRPTPIRPLTTALGFAALLTAFVTPPTWGIETSAIILARPIREPDDSITIGVTGPGGPKHIEVSSDLKAWRTLAIAASGSTTVTIPPPAAAHTQFFRARTAEHPGSDFVAEATEIQSSRITVEWAPPRGASRTRIFLAPEPGLLRVEGPTRRLIATLPGEAGAYTIESLAAAVHVFIRIEAEVEGVLRSAHVHARTIGGPRARLSNRVREVQGYAPDILLVTLANGAGTGLTSGWSVRRANGREVSVRSVHRNTIPVGAPDYPLGLGDGGSDRVDVDHRLFLVLSEAIGGSDLLDIRGPGDLAFTLPFSDAYLETPVLQLNQVGYNPRARHRWAYVSGWMGDGGPLALAAFPAEAEILAEPADPLDARVAVARRLPVRPRRTLDVDAGTEVRDIDLAGVPASETVRYRIRLPGVGVSWRTQISERAAFKAFYTLARGLYHNRWGGDLRPDLTEWSRPADHEFVFTAESDLWNGTLDGNFPFEPTTPQVGRRRLQGGHHDAGDFDLRPFHTAVPQMLLRAFELSPASFPDGQLHLPESGNGIPDLLDEALWNIAAWEQLQEDDGGVRLGVESWRHPRNQGILAHLDDLPYWTYSRDPHHTARCAGLFAQAARLVRPFDLARSDALRARARRAWTYATNHSAAVVLRLYPAGELHRLTGEAGFRQAFEAAWRSLGDEDWQAFQRVAGRIPDTSVFMEHQSADADHLCAYLSSLPPNDPALVYARETLRSHGIQSAGTWATPESGAFRSLWPATHPIGWGQALAQARALGKAFAALQVSPLSDTDRQAIFDAASLGADYILGGNPLGLVFVTGLGTRRVEEPLHLDSLAFLKMGRGPIPGIPVYGPPGEFDGNDYVATTMNAFHPELAPVGVDESRTAPAKAGHPFFRRYADVRLWVRANEFSVMEMQGPHVQLFAYLMSGTRGVMPPESFRPGGAHHRDPLP